MQALILNGKPYTKDALPTLCSDKLNNAATPIWEQHIYRFIQQWLSDDAKVQVKTSGSTGPPKTITINRAQMEHSARLTGSYLDLKPNDTALLCLSADYIAGKMMIARAFTLGLNLITSEPTGNPLEYLPNDQVIDLIAMVPFQLKDLLTLGHTRLNDRIGRIRNILLGGAPVSNELREQLKDFPNNIYETFGMTETVSHIALKKLSGGATQTYFETTDQSIILGQDDRDCLVIIAPELSPAAVVTNDVVELMNERDFKWLGRVDNVINSGGVKMMAEDLEHRINGLVPHRYFFAPKPDIELGQKLMLVIESPDYSLKEEQELFKKLQTVLGRFEVPKEILYTPHFTDTETLKVNRKATLTALGIVSVSPLS